MTMYVNHLAPTYLTHLLMPLLSVTPQSRVINVSSRAHTRNEKMKSPLVPDFGDYFFDNMKNEEYSRARVYNTSKLANVLFTKGLDRHIKKNGLDMKTASLHPGVIRSEFWRDMGLFATYGYYLFLPVIFTVLKSENEGAQTTLHCSLMPFKQLESGGYYSDCGLISASTEGENEHNIDRSWKMTIERLKRITGEKVIFDE